MDRTDRASVEESRGGAPRGSADGSDHRRQSRRRLLAGAAGGLGALAAASVAAAPSAQAANGDKLVLGQTNNATNKTRLVGGPQDDATLAVESAINGATAVGIRGSSHLGYGLEGTSAGMAGVHGTTGNGSGFSVLAEHLGNGVAIKATTGSSSLAAMFGINEGGGGIGVQGEAGGTNPGVLGDNTGPFGGPGVHGTAVSGIGVIGDGRTGVRGTGSAGDGIVGIGITSGVHGQTASASGSGVLGEVTGSGGGPGVKGFSDHGVGVLGTSNSGPGVRATNSDATNPAVDARNDGDGIGVSAFSNSGLAIKGDGATGGVHGVCVNADGVGVIGENTNQGPTGLIGAGVKGIASNENAFGVFAVNTGGGTGVFSQTNGGPSTILGINQDNGAGIEGRSAIAAGVLGESGRTLGVNGMGPQAGVQGTASTANGIGVAGLNSAGGTGVKGVVDEASGTGVAAASARGTALRVDGKAAFSRSGVATISAGKASKTVSAVTLSAKSMVLVTLQQNRAGVFVQSAVPDPAADTFTVFLNKPVPQDTKVAWFVLN